MKKNETHLIYMHPYMIGMTEKQVMKEQKIFKKYYFSYNKYLEQKMDIVVMNDPNE